MGLVLLGLLACAAIMRDAVLVARPLLDWHADSLVDVLGLLVIMRMTLAI